MEGWRGIALSRRTHSRAAHFVTDKNSGAIANGSMQRLLRAASPNDHRQLHFCGKLHRIFRSISVVGAYATLSRPLRPSGLSDLGDRFRPRSVSHLATFLSLVCFHWPTASHGQATRHVLSDDNEWISGPSIAVQYATVDRRRRAPRFGTSQRIKQNVVYTCTCQS